MTVEKDAGNKVVDSGGVEVATRTLDELVPAGTALIKLDLEGHELEALRGAAQTLTCESLLAFVIETFRWHNWETPLLREMEELLDGAGFRPVAYDPVRRVLKPLRGLESRPEPTGNNTIYVRNIEVVDARLRTASRVKIGRAEW